MCILVIGFEVVGLEFKMGCEPDPRGHFQLAAPWFSRNVPAAVGACMDRGTRIRLVPLPPLSPPPSFLLRPLSLLPLPPGFLLLLLPLPLLLPSPPGFLCPFSRPAFFPPLLLSLRLAPLPPLPLFLMLRRAKRRMRGRGGK